MAVGKEQAVLLPEVSKVRGHKGAEWGISIQCSVMALGGLVEH
jgi:hypothetical protein